MAKQIETATIVGTVTGSGNAIVTVTAFGMGNSPKAITVAVTNGDTASVVAQAARYALATDSDVSLMFLVGGSGANVTLTRRIDSENDSSLNIASANGTCTGLTAEPTSTNSQAGTSVITHGYVTIDQFHSYKRVGTEQVTDDTVIALLIESASRYIDRNTSRRFFLNGVESHYFNVPGWEAWITSGHSYYSGYGNPTQINEPSLMLDDDLYSLTSVVNGDGTTLVENTDFVQVPFNGLPKYKLEMIGTNYWKAQGNTNPVRCILVSGTWGYCDIADVPGDLVEACLMIVSSAYNRRLGENVMQKVQVSTAGAVISPDDVPAKSADILRCYQRHSFG